MHKKQKTIDVVKSLHKYQDKEIETSEMIRVVCEYYDFIKAMPLKQADLEFLRKIASTVGIPHYFDHLSNFQKNAISVENISLNQISSQIYESTLYTDENRKLHKYQKEILSQFSQEKENRFFLSASTSFGKTYLVYEILRKMKYKNIVLIFPTIALLSENLERLHQDPFYSDYSIHTLSDVDSLNVDGMNIFIYTPERFLSFLEKNKVKPNFDFIFIDEVYKIDNEYIIDEDERKESERDISYRVAAYYSVLGKADILLAGPYIERYSTSFEKFLAHNRIEKLNFNQYEIVGKSYHSVNKSRKFDLNDNIVFNFDSSTSGKQERLNEIVTTLVNDTNENSIIYCSTPRYAEQYAKDLPTLIEYEETNNDYKSFVSHVAEEYGHDWVVTNSLKKGIGIHHGLIPKYIQKELIKFFNEGTIKTLTSTTTLTEGVNTSAKNLIITNNKKGEKRLKRFDAKNIAGRAGRFEKHYSGRVIVLLNKFLDDINAGQEEIHHKNYDLDSKKDEIDLFYSNDDFLTAQDKIRRNDIIAEQEKRDIPDYILDMFKIVSKADKIKIYDRIGSLDPIQHTLIKNLIQRANMGTHVGIDWDGLQTVLDCVSPIIHGPLKELIGRKTNQGTGKHSILIPMLYNYLETGFKGLVNFKKHNGEHIDQATKNTARFVYNTAKYQLVKYLGVFNVMYKFHKSISDNMDFELVSGIDKLLTKLEYNALTEIGKKVSDYGVPAKVLQYYEEGQVESIRTGFDAFERRVFDNLQTVIKRN